VEQGLQVKATTVVDLLQTLVLLLVAVVVEQEQLELQVQAVAQVLAVTVETAGTPRLIRPLPRVPLAVMPVPAATVVTAAWPAVRLRLPGLVGMAVTPVSRATAPPASTARMACMCT
jgi:hypothetical protein